MNAKQTNSDENPSTVRMYSITLALAYNLIRFIFCLLLILLIINYTPI